PHPPEGPRILVPLLCGEDRETGRSAQGSRERAGPLLLRPNRDRPRRGARLRGRPRGCCGQGRLPVRSLGLLRSGQADGRHPITGSSHPTAPHLSALIAERSLQIVNALKKWFVGNWSVPVVSGVLIMTALAVRWLAAGAANRTVGPQWWLDAG